MKTYGADGGRFGDDRDGLEARLAVYQLYHVLNHANLFGGGYAAQARSMIGRLLSNL